VTSLDLISEYPLMVELRSDAMLYSILGNENSDAGPYQLSTRAAFGPWAEDTRPCYIAS